MSKKRSRKQILVIGLVIIAVIILIISLLINFILPQKYTEVIKNFLTAVNPLKLAKDIGEGITKTKDKLNKTEAKAEAGAGGAGGGGGGAGGGTGGGGGTTEETVKEGSGKLYIYNEVDRDYGFDIGLHRTIHYEGATEGLDSDKDQIYGNPPGSWTKATKIISNISGYELINDIRPLNSTSTIYLELSLHTKSNSSITVSNLQNELYLSFPLANEGYTFGSKTITLQQYSPDNANAVYTLYNVRDVINNNNGIIVLPNLNGTYVSQVPYAYFKIMFS